MTAAPIDLDYDDDALLPDDGGNQIYIRDGKPGPRWEPDLQMAAAVLSMPKSSRELTEMELPDRCWLVAFLTVAGCTAENIAERCRCSVRLVRAVRAEPMTQLCEFFHAELRRQETELRVERIDHAATRRELGSAASAVGRLRTQMEQLLDAHIAGDVEKFRCGHPKVPYNVYRYRGRDNCRECGRDRVARYRATRVTTVTTVTCVVTQTA